VLGVHEVITLFKFGDDRFRGFWLAEGQSLPFPIDFEGRLYNTHTIVWGVMTILYSYQNLPYLYGFIAPKLPLSYPYLYYYYYYYYCDGSHIFDKPQ